MSRNILIIGGSSGIGKVLANELADQGNSVYATYLKHPSANGEYISYHLYDVFNTDADFSYLPDALHGLVYCPGAIVLKPFARILPESFLYDYQLQVVGAVKVIQSVLPRLKATGNASVVLFSTVAAQVGMGFHTNVAATKGAIEGLTRALAAEFAPAIRVNAIAPSLTDTPLAEQLLNTDDKRAANAQRHPMKRIGTPADIAAAASFLLSDKAGWITGQVIHVDGGMGALR